MDEPAITIPEREFSQLIDSIRYTQGEIPNHKNHAYDLLDVIIQAMEVMRRNLIRRVENGL